MSRVTGLSLQLERSEQWVFLALDKSSSMDGARLEAAKDGAIAILETLCDGDMLCIFTFDHQVTQLLEPTEVNAMSKVLLLLAIKSIKAEGGTALYDAVLATSQEILKRSFMTKLLQGALGDQKTRRFVLVVLTDGADQHSKHKIEDTRKILTKVNREIPHEIDLKIHFIGVQLDTNAERALKSLKDAAGERATYERVESTDAIKRKFHEIQLGIVAKTAQATKVDWNGFMGRHVKIVGSSRGLGGMRLGAIGVVNSQDSDGDYRVDFSEKNGWCAGPGDIEIDRVADEVRPGARVRVKRAVALSSLKFGQGPLKEGMVGLCTSVSHDGHVKVDYGYTPKNELTFLLQELEPVYSDEGHWKNSAVQCGQVVRVKEGVAEPSTKWANIRRGDVGFAQNIDDKKVVRCNFPRNHGWLCKAEELEVDRLASLIKPGEKVRVKSSVDEPACGWGDVTHESVGQVISLSYDAKVSVAFPSRTQPWHAHLCELEPIPGDELSIGDLKIRAARLGITDKDIAACCERTELDALIRRLAPMPPPARRTPKASAPPAVNPAAAITGQLLRAATEASSKQNGSAGQAFEFDVPTAVPKAAPDASSSHDAEMAAAMMSALVKAIAEEKEEPRAPKCGCCLS